MSKDLPDAGRLHFFEMAIIYGHAALGFWVSWNHLVTSSATYVRMLVGLFAVTPFFGTAMTSIAIIWRGDGIWRVIVPLALWGLAVALYMLPDADKQYESSSPSISDEPKPSPRSPLSPKSVSEPRSVPTSMPTPQSASGKPPSIQIRRSEPTLKPEAPSARTSDLQAVRRQVQRPGGSDVRSRILGEPRDERFEASEVARRVQRSGGSGLGKPSTCRSCGTGIDIFSGRCGCT